jgi:ADP-ribosylglycohydrolase
MRIWAKDLSSLTHPHPTNRVLCSLCCELVHLALAAGCWTTSMSPPVLGKMDKEWLAKVFTEEVHRLWIPSDDQGEHIAEVVNRLQSYKDIEAWAAKAATDLKITGSALDAFEAALWCFFARDTFREGAIEAASLGGDSAAIGATYGALAGAYYGYEAIPSEWISEIQTPKVLEDVVDGLGKLREKHITQ